MFNVLQNTNEGDEDTDGFWFYTHVMNCAAPTDYL